SIYLSIYLSIFQKIGLSSYPDVNRHFVAHGCFENQKKLIKNVLRNNNLKINQDYLRTIFIHRNIRNIHNSPSHHLEK
ncbi:MULTISPECIES: hypothetical protein, partial [unclassified Chryseobacterium]|uniref:hypothetical protein n=1 Tax=unclassified Chryseobacterium TaxID=2593645 RepID=UPI002269D124